MIDYIKEKASQFLSMEQEKYTSHDAFGMRQADLDKEKMELLKFGCRQIIEGKGQAPDNPLESIGISGFYRLIDLLHFHPVLQSIIGIKDNGILDKMNCAHMFSGKKLVLYNLVSFNYKLE